MNPDNIRVIAKDVITMGGARKSLGGLDSPDSKATKFLRYYRQTAGKGTMDPALIEVV